MTSTPSTSNTADSSASRLRGCADQPIMWPNAFEPDPAYRSPNRRHDRRFFYKYVSPRVAKIILETRKLRWSSPLQFNDPFDVTRELPLNFTEAELNAALAEGLVGLIEEADYSYAPSHPLLGAFFGALNQQRDPHIRRRIAEGLRREPAVATAGQINAFAELRQLWRDLVPRFRLLCLSELKDVTSMWLRYADSYCGAVLEFEAVDHLDGVFLLARPVTYQDAPPAIASGQAWARCLLSRSQTTYMDLFTEYQYVKTTDWAYEREWRIVSLELSGESDLFSDYPFKPRELAGVYLGPRCSKEDEEEIVALLCQGPEHVSVSKARMDGASAKFAFEAIR